MRKIIIGIITVIVLAVIIAAIFSRINAGSSSTQNIATESHAETPGKIYAMPTSTTITLGTPHGSVTMKNFYLSSAGAEENFIVLAQDDAYQITYDPTTNSFYLSVQQAPYDTVRIQAETDFLERLGITKTDACKLNVTEGFGNQQASLSFCKSSVIQ